MQAVNPKLFPVLLYATPQKDTFTVGKDPITGKEVTLAFAAPPAVQLSMILRPFNGTGVNHFQWFAFLLQELDVAIPQAWLLRLFDFLNEVSLHKPTLC